MLCRASSPSRTPTWVAFSLVQSHGQMHGQASLVSTVKGEVQNRRSAEVLPTPWGQCTQAG